MASTRSSRNSRTASARWHQPSRYQRPSTSSDPHRVDVALGGLVAGRHEVGQVQPAAARRARAGRRPARRPRPRPRPLTWTLAGAASPGGGLELGQGAVQGVAVVQRRGRRPARAARRSARAPRRRRAAAAGRSCRRCAGRRARRPTRRRSGRRACGPGVPQTKSSSRSLTSCSSVMPNCRAAASASGMPWRRHR